MTQDALTRSLTVKEDEQALVMCDGRLKCLLGPGRYRIHDPQWTATIEFYDVTRGGLPADRYALLKAALPKVADEMLEAVETGAGEVAIVSLGGQPTHLVGPHQLRVYWKAATRVEVERIDTASNPKIEPRHLAMIERTRLTPDAATRLAQFLVAETVVESHETGLLHFDGRLVERLAPGRHAYWAIGRKVEIKRLNLATV